MAVVSRVATLVFSGATGSRTWQATAAVQDTGAGSSVAITTTTSTTGVTPPAVADTLTLNLYNDNGVLIRSFTLTPGSASQTSTFHFTADGTSTGAARCGTVEIALRATKTTGGPTNTYDYETDGSPSTPQVAFTATQIDRGWIRGTTTLTLSTSNVAAGGAVPSIFGYPDQLFQRATLGAAAYVNRTLTLAIGGVKSGLSNSTTGPSFDRTHTGIVDTAFSAGSNVYAQTAVAGNATLTGQPFTTFTTTTAPTLTIDPRLTRTPLFQLDDNTFGTPPLSKDEPDHRRLTTQQGFLASRTTNARGEGVNGVVYNVTLTPRRPGTAVSQTGLTTTTQGGQTGWAPSFLPWSASLPGGVWDKAITITSPSGYTGSYVVQNGSLEYTLVARDPNLEVRVNVQHEPTLGGRHYSAGMALIPTAYLINVETGVRILASLLTFARVAVVRAAAAANPDGTGTSWEFLNTSFAWESWETAEAQAAHTMSISTADATTVEKRFATDSSWGLRDIRFNVAVEYEGVLYSATYIVINLATNHQHDTAEVGGSVTPQDKADIVNGVWDELSAESRTPGSYGALVAARLDATVGSRATPADVATARDAVLAAVDMPLQADDARLARLDVAVSTRATPADVNGAVASLTAQLTAISQQVTDLAAAGVDDATLAQLTSARDAILAAIEATDATIGGEVS